MITRQDSLNVFDAFLGIIKSDLKMLPRKFNGIFCGHGYIGFS